MQKKKKKIIKVTSLICRMISIIAWVEILIDWIICAIDYGIDDFFESVVFPEFEWITFIAYIIFGLTILVRIFIPKILDVIYDEEDEKAQ